jgi:hypothetical protein
MRRKQKQLERKWAKEAKLEAEKEAQRVAEIEAELREQEEIATQQRLLTEQRENDRLHQKHIQRKQKTAEQKWDKQFETLMTQIKNQRQKDDKLEEIRIIIQNREPSLQNLDWDSWLADPLNQRLADLDFDRAEEMFKRDNLLADRRKPTRGKSRKVIPKYALVFSGDRAGATDSYATTTFNPDTYELWNGFTISFWVRPDEEMNQKSVILGSRASSPVARFHFGFSGAGDNNIGIGVGGNDVTGINNPMEVGKWYNWVVSYTGTQGSAGNRKLRLWVNTAERMSNNNSTSWGNQDEGMTMYFGGRNTEDTGYSNGFACALTNVAIYNVCKDSDGTFANQVYNNGIKHNYTGDDDLVGYWRFNEGSGITIKDTSGNGNNGTFGAISGNTKAYPIWEKI